jgi:hypothetical protein
MTLSLARRAEFLKPSAVREILKVAGCGQHHHVRDAVVDQRYRHFVGEPLVGHHRRATGQSQSPDRLRFGDRRPAAGPCRGGALVDHTVSLRRPGSLSIC